MKFLNTPLVIALVLPGVMGLTSPCGEPDDICMDKENWKQCRNLEVNECKSIQVLKSCPLQFACGDDDENLQQDNGDALALSSPPSDEIVGEKQNACVRLYVYRDSKCNGPPVRVNSFPTWSRPGSPCYHDATMRGYSVRDQYCSQWTGNYHETVIVGSNTCHKPHWWEGGGKYDFTFTTDSCIEGISLKGCFKGPCDSPETDMDDIQVRDASAKL